jgi:futalosine hydrolase
MILLLAAAPAETTLIRQQLKETKSVKQFAHSCYTGSVNGHDLLLVHGGIGSITMAIQTIRILMNVPIDTVLLFGCGGSYPQNDLKLGDIVLADSEVYGDLGVEIPTGFIPLEHLGIPQDPQLAPLAKQHMDLDQRLLNWAKTLLPQAMSGPFVTVNRCSGTDDLSQSLFERTGGICENMEGAAVAEVCREFNIPLLELRGISNQTGNRNNHQWDLRLAVHNAQQAVQKLLAEWPPT